MLMFEYPVRRWFWFSLITALAVLALEFIVGWIGVVLFAFSFLPMLGIVAAVAYPLFVFLIVIFWLIASDFMGAFRAPVIWVEDAYSFDSLLARAVRLAERMRVKFDRLGVASSSALNAFTYGVFRPKIVVYKGLLEKFTREEVDFVVAHELGHIKHRWVWLLYSMANASVILPLFMPLIVRVFFYLVFIPARFALLWFSRECEYIADREAVLATGNLAAAISALIKLGRAKGLDVDLSRLSERDLVEKVVGDAVASLSTHPLIKRRIRELLKVYGSGFSKNL